MCMDLFSLYLRVCKHLKKGHHQLLFALVLHEQSQPTKATSSCLKSQPLILSYTHTHRHTHTHTALRIGRQRNELQLTAGGRGPERFAE